MINKSRHLQNSYSDWRRSVQDKFTGQYCLDIDFVEYIYHNGNIIPYLLIEISEPTITLEACSWMKNIHRFKSEQASVLRYFSKQMQIPWLIVLTQISNNERIFKIYNDELISEKIYSEKDYIKILKKFQSDIYAKKI